MEIRPKSSIVKDLSSARSFADVKMKTPVEIPTARDYTRSITGSIVSSAQRSSLVGGRSKGLELDHERQHVKDLGELMGKVDSLSEELRAKKKALAELEGEKTRLIPYKEQFSLMKAEYEKTKAENKRLTAENEQTKQELAVISQKRYAELEKLHKTVEDMERRIVSEKESRRAEEERMREIIKALEYKNKSLADDLNDTKIEKEKYEKIAAEQTMLYQNNKRKLYEAIETSKQRENALNIRLENAHESINKLETTKAELLRNLDVYTKEAEYFKECLRNEKEITKDLSNKIAAQQKSFENLNVKNERLTDAYASIKAELEKSQELLEKQTKLINMMRDTVKDDKGVIKRQEEELDRLQELLVELRREKGELLKELDNETMKSTGLRRQVEVLENVKAGLENHVRELKEEQIRLNAEISVFSNAKQELSNARMKEIGLLSKAITNAYGEQ